MYTGYKNYLNTAQFESTATPAQKVDLLPAAEQIRFKFTPTGHGFVNALNCAEFCEKNYTVKAFDTAWATQAMWHDDCGLNPIYPQGGTWLYDRATGARAAPPPPTNTCCCATVRRSRIR